MVDGGLDHRPALAARAAAAGRLGAKLEVFRAAIDAGQAWLAVVAIANTVVSLYPYLRVAAPTILDRDAGAGARLPAGPALAAATLLTGVLTVAIGIGAEPLIRLAERAVGITGG